MPHECHRHRLGDESDSGFHNEPHSLTPYGDELVVTYATNTVSFGGTVLDVDAIVVWRVALDFGSVSCLVGGGGTRCRSAIVRIGAAASPARR